MLEVDHVVQAVGSLFAAAPLDHHLWNRALEALASATGSGRGQLIGLGGPTLLPFNHITGMDPDAVDECAMIGGYHERVNFRIAASQRAIDMTIIDDRHYADVIPSLADERYVQYCEEAEIPFGCQTSLMSGDGGLVGLAMLRTRRDGMTTPEQRAIFTAVAPLVRAAVRTQIALRGEGHTLLAGTLDAMAARALVCDGFGHIRIVTPAADALLSRGNRLRIGDGRLVSRIGVETHRIDAALARVLDGSAIDGEEIVLPPLPGEPDMLKLSIRPLAPLEWDFGHSPRALITLHAREAEAPDAMIDVAMRSGLTRAEAEVAAALASGMSRARIAERRGVSLDTVKSQLKSIFLKMDVNRELELARRLREMR